VDGSGVAVGGDVGLNVGEGGAEGSGVSVAESADVAAAEVKGVGAGALVGADTLGVSHAASSRLISRARVTTRCEIARIITVLSQK
jgi:hypothetical protein